MRRTAEVGGAAEADVKGKGLGKRKGYGKGEVKGNVRVEVNIICQVRQS